MLGILGGPVGPITFTAMSTRSIHIQINKGSQVGQFNVFQVRRDNMATVCDIPIHRILTECTDSHARQGDNLYRIAAFYPGVSWGPRNYNAHTLQQDRMHFLTFT